VTALRHVDFLKNLEQLRFTGQLVQTDAAGQMWTFYLSQGRILYATGGTHPVRRWRRNLITFCPRIPTYRLAWQIDLAKVSPDRHEFSWEYALLDLWVTQQRITREQAEKLVNATVTEMLFDVMQAGNVTDKIQYSKAFSPLFRPIEVETAIVAAYSLQQQWHKAGLDAYSPNQAAIVKQPDQLRQVGSAQLYQTLISLLDGQRTLRDVAVEMRRDVVDIATALHGCAQLGLIEFTTVADLPTLVFQRDPPGARLATASTSQALIACVDDSFTVRNMMERLLRTSGYQFLGIDDPLRAIGILLARKPDFIFLDLVMPNVNGYEICEKLRQISCFRKTPIVILTGSDGYANRLRSNFVGASDFLSKPLNAEAVLGVINKHLNQPKSDLSSTMQL
jgi:two-component system, chemotaxis family, response regulator PixG